MTEAVPSPDEIMALARDILQFAVRRRGENELDHPPEGSPNTEGFYSALHQQYAWIVEAFAQALALAPDPSRLEPLIDAGRQGESTLTGGVELRLATVDINGNKLKTDTADPIDPFWSSANGVQAKVADWTGDAADTFRTNFLSVIGVVPANHAMAFRALQFAMKAAKQVYEQFLRDLKELATAARAALHPVGCHPPSLEVVIGLAAGVSKVVAGVATAEDGAGVFVAGEGLMDLVTTIVDSGKEGAGKRYTIEGADVASILASTDDLLHQTVTFLSQCEQDITKVISGNANSITTHPEYFVLPEPAVVGLAHKPVAQLWNEFD